MAMHFPNRAMRCILSVSMVVALGGCASAPPGDANRSSGGSLSAVSSKNLSNLDLARREFSRGNYGNAISYLENELAQRPASVAALNGLGACFDQLGRFDVAQQYYYRALDMSPESSVTLSNIGYSYLQQGRDKEAAQILELALERDSNNETAANNLRLAKTRVAGGGNETAIALESLDENSGESSDEYLDESTTDAVLTNTNKTNDALNPKSLAGSNTGQKSSVSVSDLEPVNSVQKQTEGLADERQNDSTEVVSTTPEQPISVPEKILPRSTLPAKLDSAVEEVNSIANASVVGPLAPVYQPVTKIAAMSPLPALVRPLSGSEAGIGARPDAVAPLTSIVAEPDDEQFLVETQINVPSAEPSATLVAAVNEANEIAESTETASRTVMQPEAEIAAISPIPVKTGIAQSDRPADKPGETKTRAPEPPAMPEPVQQPAIRIAVVDPVPVPEYSQRTDLFGARGKLVDTALASPVIPEPAPNPDEPSVQASEVPPPLVLTLIDRHDLPETTLRILETQELTPEEASDIQTSQLPSPDEENSEKLPELAYEEESEHSPGMDNTITNEPRSQEPGHVEASNKLVSGLTLSEPFKLAVANGNGMRGIARATSRWIDNEQTQITSITDADNFNYAQTVIRHRPEFAQFALAMAEKMAVNCEIQQSDDLASGVDMQLILGQDFAGTIRVRDGWISLNDNEQDSHLDGEIRLEISNGNGVNGMAARLRNFLQIRGGAVVRLTNADNFSYDESILYYRQGKRAAAERLAVALPVPGVALRESSELSSNVDARLLIGRDFEAYDVGQGK